MEKAKKNIIKNNKFENIEKLKNEKERKLQENKDNYLLDLKTIKEKYEAQLKKRKIEFEQNNRKISNEYKLKEDKMNYTYIKLIKELEMKRKNIENKLELNKKIEELTNMKTINKLIYTTYIQYKENIFNSINIRHAILNFYENNKNKNNKILIDLFHNDFNIINTFKEKVNSFQNKSNTFKTKIGYNRERANHQLNDIHTKTNSIKSQEIEKNENKCQLPIFVNNYKKKFNLPFNIIGPKKNNSQDLH